MNGNQMGYRKSSGTGVFLIFLVVGAYFLNIAFNFIPIPAALSGNATYNQALNFIAGVFIIVGGFKFLFSRRGMY